MRWQALESAEACIATVLELVIKVHARRIKNGLKLF
jgi:hypothetical protein